MENQKNNEMHIVSIVRTNRKEDFAFYPKQIPGSSTMSTFRKAIGKNFQKKKHPRVKPNGFNEINIHLSLGTDNKNNISESYSELIREKETMVNKLKKVLDEKKQKIFDISNDYKRYKSSDNFRIHNGITIQNFTKNPHSPKVNTNVVKGKSIDTKEKKVKAKKKYMSNEKLAKICNEMLERTREILKQYNIAYDMKKTKHISKSKTKY